MWTRTQPRACGLPAAQGRTGGQSPWAGSAGLSGRSAVPRLGTRTWAICAAETVSARRRCAYNNPTDWRRASRARGSRPPRAAHTHIQLPPRRLLLLPLLGHPLRPLRLGLPPVLLFFLLRQVFKVRSDVTCFAVHYRERRDLPRVPPAIAPTPGWPGGPSPGPRHRLAEQGRTPWAASPASARNEPSLLCLPHVQWEHGHRALQREHFHAPNITTPFTTRHEEDTPLGRPSIKQSEALTLSSTPMMFPVTKQDGRAPLKDPGRRVRHLHLGETQADLTLPGAWFSLNFDYNG